MADETSDKTDDKRTKVSVQDGAVVVKQGGNTTIVTPPASPDQTRGLADIVGPQEKLLSRTIANGIGKILSKTGLKRTAGEDKLFRRDFDQLTRQLRFTLNLVDQNAGVVQDLAKDNAEIARLLERAGASDVKPLIEKTLKGEDLTAKEFKRLSDVMGGLATNLENLDVKLKVNIPDLVKEVRTLVESNSADTQLQGEALRDLTKTLMTSTSLTKNELNSLIETSKQLERGITLSSAEFASFGEELTKVEQRLAVGVKIASVKDTIQEGRAGLSAAAPEKQLTILQNMVETLKALGISEDQIANLSNATQELSGQLAGGVALDTKQLAQLEHHIDAISNLSVNQKILTSLKDLNHNMEAVVFNEEKTQHLLDRDIGGKSAKDKYAAEGLKGNVLAKGGLDFLLGLAGLGGLSDLLIAGYDLVKLTKNLPSIAKGGFGLAIATMGKFKGFLGGIAGLLSKVPGVGRAVSAVAGIAARASSALLKYIPGSLAALLGLGGAAAAAGLGGGGEVTPPVTPTTGPTTTPTTTGPITTPTTTPTTTGPTVPTAGGAGEAAGGAAAAKPTVLQRVRGGIGATLDKAKSLFGRGAGAVSGVAKQVGGLFGRIGGGAVGRVATTALSGAGKAVSAAGKFVKGVPVLGTALSFGGALAEGDTVGRAGARAGGATAGAIAGGTLGSVVPVVGTAIGGIIGGIAGDFIGEKMYDFVDQGGAGKVIAKLKDGTDFLFGKDGLLARTSTFFGDLADGVKKYVDFDAIGNIVKTTSDKIFNEKTGLMAKAKDFFSGAAGQVSDTASSAWSGVKGFAEKGFTSAKNLVSGVFPSATSNENDRIAQIGQIGKEEATTAKTLGSQNKIKSPVPNDTVLTSPIGKRNIAHGSSVHQGIDLGATDGSPVVSSIPGTVSQVNNSNWPANNFVAIQGPDGIITRHRHLSPTVKVGDQVEPGQTIGTVNTRKPDGSFDFPPHQHFEVLKDGKFLDPFEFLKLGGVKGIKVTENGQSKDIQETTGTQARLPFASVLPEANEALPRTAEAKTGTGAVETAATAAAAPMTGEEKNLPLPTVATTIKPDMEGPTAVPMAATAQLEAIPNEGPETVKSNVIPMFSSAPDLRAANLSRDQNQLQQQSNQASVQTAAMGRPQTVPVPVQQGASYGGPRRVLSIDDFTVAVMNTSMLEA